ncbi:MAG: hypothetical protein HQM08_22650 [Candidatus Riflebacteria bacterium]|nr:hypothetical protein [Candidatus Riflebacteria bacterium]
MRRFLSSLVLIIFFVGLVQGLLACGASTTEEKYFGVINGFPSNEITALAVDRKGNLFVGTEDKGLVAISAVKEKVFQIINTDSSLSFNSINSLAVSEDNTLWVGTSGGLNRVSIGKGLSNEAKFFADDGLKDNICLSLAVNENGNSLWVGTTGGLVAKGMGYKRYTDSDGLPSNIIQSLTMDVEGNLWIGTSNGLMKKDLDGMKKIDLNQKNPTISYWINDLATLPIKAKDYIEKVRVSFQCINLGFSNRDPRLEGVDSRLPHQEVQRFLEDIQETYERETKKGLLYVATNGGCFWVNRQLNLTGQFSDAWFTALAVNFYGCAFAAKKNLQVFPVGFEGEVEGIYDVGELIKKALRQLIGANMGKSEEERAKTLSTQTCSLLKEFEGKLPIETENWIEKLMASKTVSAMCFSPLGHLWVGVKGGGLFRFRPIIFNHDSFIFSIFLFNKLLFDDQMKGFRKTEKPATGFKLKTKPVTYPEIKELLDGLKFGQTVLPETKNFWIGKWSELEMSDCELISEFLASWGFDLCLMKLAKVLKADPYVVIPIANNE